jgi:hypothetical protein
MMEVESFNSRDAATWWSRTMPFTIAESDNQLSQSMAEYARLYARRASRHAFIMYPDLREQA